MKSRLACTIVFAATVLALSGCGSTHKKDNDDFYDDYGKRKKSMSERMSDWMDRSRERENEKFERMFDRASG
ncbi:MAG: hypothetical protein R3F19_01250 [Verrucomicrobiales bacterium]|nr:hypothetical protein [Verrucomicrobiae bacterium]